MVNYYMSAGEFMKKYLSWSSFQTKREPIWADLEEQNHQRSLPLIGWTIKEWFLQPLLMKADCKDLIKKANKNSDLSIQVEFQRNMQALPTSHFQAKLEQFRDDVQFGHMVDKKSNRLW